MTESEILQRLSELGLELPAVPVPVASYVPVTVAGGLAFVSGQIPMSEGRPLAVGTLGSDVTVAEAQHAAAQAALQAISALRVALGSLDRVKRVAQVTVYVAAIPGFLEHPEVANGASELFIGVFGEAGQHARAAIGMSSLPRGASVEVAVIVEVTPA
ncbi:MAG: RidA family protein [Actinomycetota bacterium]|jgi:enamine deaminase RidA (YjgF/YER057c/UK114 family)|nr:RidA family protein [Actinomycetota bacterium]